MIVQNVSADGATTDLTFTVPAADFERARTTIVNAKTRIGYARLDAARDVTKVSVIGVGMRSHAGVAAQAFRALADRGINIRAITTSEIKFSLLIDAAYTELAVRTLHSLYGLIKFRFFVAVRLGVCDGPPMLEWKRAGASAVTFDTVGSVLEDGGDRLVGARIEQQRPCASGVEALGAVALDETAENPDGRAEALLREAVANAG